MTDRVPDNGLSRRDVLRAGAGLTATAALGGLGSALAAPAGRRPNVIVILADDLGYRDLGVQGCPDIPTPNIDSIARSGVRFTDGYVTCPVCAPTRAGLATGRYQQRFGFEANPGPSAYADADFGLPPSETTLAERMKGYGYATGMVGKWHLGYRPELQPPKRGFDELFGFLEGANNYLPGRRGARNPILRGTEPVEEKEYLTDAFAREAVGFIDKHNKDPFFLYLAFNAVHSPMEAIEAYLRRFSGIKDEKRRTYAAMTAALDDGVGRVLAALRRHRLEEDTLLFFWSDNGGPTPQTTSSNLPLRGYKTQVYEGGIRIPAMVQWKGHIPAGKVGHRPVVALDIHPTAVAAIGQTVQPEWKLDGMNLLPHLTGRNKKRPHDALLWRMHGQHAARVGDHKILRRSASGTWELYNLADDIGEKADLAAKMPDKVKELDAAWRAWSAQMKAPGWVRQDGRTQDGGGAGRRGGAGQGSLDERFRAFDRNGDGKLTADEVPNERLFTRLDTNADGVVTQDEAREALRRRP